MSIVTDLSKKLVKIKNITQAKVLGNGINAFWWSQKKNFGDLLTPELFKYYGYTPIETHVSDADIIGVGSLMHLLPSNYSGTLIGTGIIDDSEISLEQAHFAAVRGELSKTNLGLPQSTPTGDLGLLAQSLLKSNNSKKRYAVGLVPHFVDKAHPWIQYAMQELGDRGCIIEVQDSAANVINRIAQCDIIVSSSLHGIIVSDALKIPNVWMELSDKVIGKGFKFWDYNSSIDYEQPPINITNSTSIADIEANVSHKNAIIISKKSVELEQILKKTLSTCY